MSAWSTYQDRIDAHGGSKRDAAYNREVRYINSKLPDNLSSHLSKCSNHRF